MATDRSDRYTECSLDLYQVQTIQGEQQRLIRVEEAREGRFIRSGGNNMKKLQSYKKYGNQVRTDDGWWKILVLLKAETKMTIKALVEHALSNTYGIDKDGKPYFFENKEL